MDSNTVTSNLKLVVSTTAEGIHSINAASPSRSVADASALLERVLNPAIELPHEILDTICDHLHRCDLISLRLTSKAWQPSAEKALFDVIYLKFDGTSFQHLQNISDHPKFSKLVHYIHYDSRRLENAPAFMKKSLQMSNDQYLSVYTRVANEQRLADGVESRLEFVDALTQFQEYQSRFLAYAAAQRLFSRDGKEINALGSCISKLPNLLGLRHFFHETGASSWPLPRFTGPDSVSESILGVLSRQTSSKSHEHFWNLFGAAHFSGATKRLRELSGSDFQLNKWSVGAVPYIKSFDELTTLHTLDLELFEVAHVHPNPTTLAALLKSVPSLQSLQLKYVPGYDSNHLSLAGTMPSDFHWRHLGHLVLHGFETTESYFRSFLLKHAKTLYSLELGRMLFQPEGGKPGSWIEFILFLNESLRLRHVNFRGILSNGVDEAWHVHSHDAEEDEWPSYFGPRGCLKHRIERFITACGSCPFDPLPEDADLAPYFNLPWMFNTDSSWRFAKRELQEFSDSD